MINISTINNLRNEAIKHDCDIEEILLKSYVLAKKIHDDSFLNWIEKERYGYTDKTQVPDYRIIPGELMAFNPFRGWIPMEGDIVDKHFSSYSACEPVVQLLQKANNNTSLYIPINRNLAQKIIQNSDCPIDTELRLFLNRDHVLSIGKAIKNIIIDWLISLEEKGITGDEAEFESDRNENNKLIQEIIGACIKLSDDPVTTSKMDENSLNRLLRNNLESSLHHFGYYVQDQTQRGHSETGKSVGEIDLRIVRNNLPMAICECLIHKDKEYLHNHIHKALKNYNQSGCKMVYVICYSKCKDFTHFWKQYLEWIRSCDVVTDLSEQQESDFSGIKCLKGKFDCFGEQGIIHFVGVNLSNNSQ